jgi:hypothetical protein
LLGSIPRCSTRDNDDHNYPIGANVNTIEALLNRESARTVGVG